MLVLIIAGIGTKWGWLEALIGALAGGIGFDYYFLPPRGLPINGAEQGVDLLAFLATAVIIGQLAARLKHRSVEAEKQQSETEKLYDLTNAMLETGTDTFTVAQLAGKLVEIFGAPGVAIYDKHTDQITRSGPEAGFIAGYILQEAATLGREICAPRQDFFVAPIRHAGELVGSLGMRGKTMLPQPLISSLTGRVGLGLARLYAAQRTADARAMRQSEEMKSAVLDAMAHEIRNPLNSIKLAATTLLSGRVNESEKQEMLGIIDEEATRMDRFIDEAVRFARLEANELSLKKEPQDLARLIQTAIDEMGATAARRTIRVDVPESLPPADCDKDWILRVLKQLLNNSLKYSPEGSPLSVSAGFAEGAVIIDVVDRGPGVALDERERVFEKYYRGRAAKADASGTGLGLASAQMIVQAHGGRIWVTEPPGGGAAFHVRLPASLAEHALGAANQ
jgi:two-component system sensor histidine kinase KdpD